MDQESPWKDWANHVLEQAKAQTVAEEERKRKAAQAQQFTMEKAAAFWNLAKQNIEGMCSELNRVAKRDLLQCEGASGNVVTVRSVSSGVSITAEFDPVQCRVSGRGLAAPDVISYHVENTPTGEVVFVGTPGGRVDPRQMAMHIVSPIASGAART